MLEFVFLVQCNIPLTWQNLAWPLRNGGILPWGWWTCQQCHTFQEKNVSNVASIQDHCMRMVKILKSEKTARLFSWKSNGNSIVIIIRCNGIGRKALTQWRRCSWRACRPSSCSRRPSCRSSCSPQSWTRRVTQLLWFVLWPQYLSMFIEMSEGLLSNSSHGKARR